MVEAIAEFARELGSRRPLRGVGSELYVTLRRLADCFELQPAWGRRQIRRLLQEYPAECCTAALAVLGAGGQSRGHQYLAEQLAATGLLLDPMCDPSMCSLEESVRLARRLAAKDPILDAKLAARISSTTDEPVLARTLEILAEISDGARILAKLIQLASHSNLRIRSKAILMLGRTRHEGQWWQSALYDSDPRVRANAVESLWAVGGDAARIVFQNAANDTHHRVAANALVGLIRSGEAEATERLIQMTRHTDPLFRAAASWAMGELGRPEFAEVLTQLRKDSEDIVRRNALRALVRIRQATAA